MKRAVLRALDRASIYLPVLLMAVLALGSWWLTRQSPLPAAPSVTPAPVHEPDYYMRGFSLRTFHADGRLKSEIVGREARHYPDDDTLEVDQPTIRAFNTAGLRTVSTARRALANGDASEVQLLGDAVVTRDGARDRQGRATPPLEVRGEFLHAFTRTERLRSHRPVEVTHGNDRFAADALEYDHLERVLELRGRVRGTLSSSLR